MHKSRLSRAACLALPIIATACASTAFAQTVEGNGDARVMMFDRPPTVDELRDVVSQLNVQSEPQRRTRSIEIVGGLTSSTAQRPRPTSQANYSAPPSQPPLDTPTPQSTPRNTQNTLPTVSKPVAAEASAQQAALPSGSAEEQDGKPNAFGFRVGFAFNSADIPSESYAYIDAVGGLMAQDPQLALVIEGHTDAVGSAGYNQALSERRAVSVGEYLVRVHHVDPQRIAVAGKGPTEPVTQNPYDGRNRRVEFKPARLNGNAVGVTP